MKSLVVRLSFLAAGLLLAATARADVAVPVGAQWSESVASGNVVNHGTLLGDAAERLVLGPETRITGSGAFERTLVEGVFAPGNSPGVTSGTNQAFSGSSTIEIELGGTLPGFGSGRHDQINDLATISLFGAPTLKVLSFNGFLPAPGDQFKVLTWQQGFSGSFAPLSVAPYFTANGISFTTLVTNPTGAGDLTLVAVAVPEVGAGLLVGAAGLIGLRLKRFAARRRMDSRVIAPE